MVFPELLLANLGAEPPPTALVVAFSGGRDSTVLLHALAALGARLPAPLRAVHINHRLHPDAGQWARHCRDVSAGLGVEYRSAAVAVDPADPAGLEAAARAARYDALRGMLGQGEWLLTAHHADDQLETVLLQLLRGGGPAGVAGMPARAAFGSGWLVRPLLATARTEILRYADAQSLRYIEDPSNVDRQRDRNFLRHDILPRLAQRWPAAATTVGRAARHAAQAAELLQDLAELDLARIAAPDAASLPIEPVLALGRARAENLLRHWLARRKLPLPDTRRLDELLSQAAHAAGDKAPQVNWPGAEARCWRGRIYAFEPLGAPELLSARWYGEPLPLGRGLGELRAGEGTVGLRSDVLAKGVEIRWRQGGECIRPAGQRHHRQLKDLLREAGIPPWMRGRIPLLWCCDKLAAVGDLWVADEFAASAEPAAHVEWHNRPM